ncbi:embryonic stem cell-specific 5-hydroxymethylcytosine-binding protein [Arapaima gigas]
MCGRTACTLAPVEVSKASRYRNRAGLYRRPQWREGDSDKYRPSYNKSPQSFSPVLLSLKHFNKDAPVDECVLAAMRWGLIPAWFRENDPNKMQYSTSNCRSESILEKKSYKDPLLKGQRCVVLADGFYEWKRTEKEKQPFFIYFPQSKSEGSEGSHSLDVHSQLSDKSLLEQLEEEKSEWKGWRLLTIAGLFDSWTPPAGGETLYTYTIITVPATPGLQSIHDRMPAVLNGEEEVRRWLDYGEVRSLDALKLLQPKDVLTFHPVSSLVNNSRNNSAECVQPVDLGSKKKIQAPGSSKVMMSWLQSASPAKEKKPEASIKRKAPEEEEKGGGLPHRWFSNKDQIKKPALFKLKEKIRLLQKTESDCGKN